MFQSFIDELAHAAGKDPLQFRLDLLARPRVSPGTAAARTGDGFNAERMRGVLELVREKSGWGRASRRPAAGWASRSSSATAAISPRSPTSAVDAANKVKVNKVWVAGDIGSQIINPSTAMNEVQGVGHRRPQPR